MENGIIKGEGNSRYLKSVKDFLTRYPDYQSFAQALMEGTLPIDINGIDPRGWAQIGTMYRKETMLTDETSEMLGGADTVNEALAYLNRAISTAAEGIKIKNGTYTGDGSGTKTISLGFRPKAVFIRNAQFQSIGTSHTLIYLGQEIEKNGDGKTTYREYSVTENGISIEGYGTLTSTIAENSLNTSKTVYNWIAFTWEDT